MATHIREGMTAESVADICDATHAALGTDPETEHLARTWRAATEKIDALAAGGRKLERAQRRTRARLAVVDVTWDGTTAAFGRAVVDASNGRRDQAPYTRFFTKVAPSAAQNFGPSREVETGRAWLTELARQPDEPLARTWAPKLKVVTDALDAAVLDRDNAAKALEPHRTAVMLFIEDINREIDRLEGDLKKLFPGDAPRVASYLSAFRSTRNATPIDEPVPVVPVAPVTPTP